MAGIGLAVRIDPAGSIYGRREGRDSKLPVILFGSHIDSVPNGGNFDGDVGSMAAIEVMRTLKDAGLQTRHPLECVVWTNEEGSRFSPGAMGSSAFVEPQRMSAYRDSRDAAGVSVAEALDAHARRFAELPLRERIAAHAFVELHIEQGPVLESAAVPLGVVSGIQGVRWYQVSCRGASAHAGTWMEVH